MILLNPLNSMKSMESMELHGFHQFEWNPWFSMESTASFFFGETVEKIVSGAGGLTIFSSKEVGWGRFS